MKKTSLLLLAIPFLFLLACKSTRKLYEQGDYEKAFYSAIDDLKKNPSNNKAQAILPDAYSAASRLHLNQIKSSSNGSAYNIQKLDAIYSSYLALQRMYNAVQGTPGAFNLIRAEDYASELEAAAQNAADLHYERGIDFMSRGGKKNAQKAYEEFSDVDSYMPGYKDVVERKEEALDLALTRVAVNNINQQFGFYNVNAAYMDNEILRDLNNLGDDNYYVFYNEYNSALKDIRVDQFMDLMMSDIWFGSPSSNKYSYTVSKEVTVTGPKDSVYKQTVYATVNVERQVVEARSVMSCRVTDAETRRIIITERFPAKYTWENQLGSFTGDSRALSEKDKAIINGSFKNPPSYDDLYRELTRQIMSEFTRRMRQVYAL